MAEQGISELEDILAEVMQAKNEEKKEWSKMKTAYERCGTLLNTQTYA